MTDYFESLEKQKQLKRILDEWLGTPFRHRCGVKGLGCDCIHFVARVFEELGYLVWRKDLIPNYPKDWHIHNTREILIEEILKAGGKRVQLSDLINGDVVLYHFGKASSHAGIYFDSYVYQALDRVGVRKIRFSKNYLKARLKFAYRAEVL